MLKFFDDFRRCTDREEDPSGGLRITCKLGFWLVQGQDRLLVEREARNYWRQYRDDGEYVELIGK